MGLLTQLSPLRIARLSQGRYRFRQPPSRATLLHMTDSPTIANAADLRNALQSGRLERVAIDSLDLPPLHLGTVAMSHVRLIGPRLTGLQIDALTAHHIQARGVLLRAVRWPKADLRSWQISSSQAQEMQLPGAHLQSCHVIDTPVTNSNFRRGQLQNCTFQQSDLNHVVLAEAFLLDCRFEDARQGGAVLDNADLRDAVLCNVDLRGANLLRANFQGAVLVDVDLRDANLRDVRFEGALLLRCRLDRTEFAHLADQQATYAEVLQRLAGWPSEVVLAVAASLLTRQATAEEPRTQGTAQGSAGDPVASLLKLTFPALVRELQGRGGPSELARLRVDGEHVWATAHTGDEVRLTNGAQTQRVAPQMAVPLPSAAPTSQVAPAPSPVVPPQGRSTALEID